MLCPILFCGGFLTAVAGHLLAALRAASHAIAFLKLTGHLHLMVSFKHHALSLLQTESLYNRDEVLAFYRQSPCMILRRSLHFFRRTACIIPRWAQLFTDSADVDEVREMRKICSKTLWVG